MSILCVTLAVACCFDYRRGRIPNWLCIFGFLGCICNNFRNAGMIGAMGGAAQTFFMILILFPLFRLGMLGAGDVKMIGVCCGWFSQERVLMFLVSFFLTAGILAVIKVIVKRNFMERLRHLIAYFGGVYRNGRWEYYDRKGEARKETRICLAGPMLLGALICWGGVL